MDWRELPEVEIGPVPYMGRSFYDGILEAYNEQFYIAYTDDIWPDECPEKERFFHNAERVYLVYSMDDSLRQAIERGEDYPLTVEPVGYILEGKLDRSL